MSAKSRYAAPLALSALALALAGPGCGLLAPKQLDPSQATYQASRGTAASAQAHALIVQQCATCHPAFVMYSDQDWIANRYVVPGNPASSILMQKLTGSGYGSPGTMADMPPGAPLTAGNIAILKNWIVNWGASPAPSPTSSPSPGLPAGPSPSPSPVGPSADQRTQAALTVLAHSCASCHASAQTATSTGANGYAGSTVQAFLGFSRDDQFVTAGLVDPGNPATSWLIRALKGYGDINAMPGGSPKIAPDQEATLEAWISGIGSP